MATTHFKEKTNILPKEILDDPDVIFDLDTSPDLTAGYSVLHLKLFGSLPAAVLYNRLYMVSQLNNPRDDGWFYLTAKTFEKYTGFTRNTFINAQDILESFGVIEKKVTFVVGMDGKMTTRKATHFRIIRDPSKIASKVQQLHIPPSQSPLLNEPPIAQNPAISLHTGCTHLCPSGVHSIYNKKNIINDNSGKLTKSTFATPPRAETLGVAQPDGNKPTSISLEDEASATLTQPLPNSAPPSPRPMPSATPFATDVSGERPADIVEYERRKKNAELASTSKKLAELTGYHHNINGNTSLRQRIKTAVNLYGAGHLIDMCRLYVSDKSTTPPEKRRLYHFLNDTTLDAIDNALSKRPKTDKLASIDPNLPDASVRFTVYDQAKQLGDQAILDLDPSDPDFLKRVEDIKNGGDGKCVQ